MPIIGTATLPPLTKSTVTDLADSNFHNAHPFLTPYNHFLAYMETDTNSFTQILLVVQYIGSLYINDNSKVLLKEKVLEQLEVPDLPLNGYTVLSFLLLTIVAYGQDDLQHARALLERGGQMAIDIGMNRRTFAEAELDPVWAESWRRTYWGLYLTDVVVAARCLQTNPTSVSDCLITTNVFLGDKLEFAFIGFEADVDLPSDNSETDEVGRSSLPFKRAKN
jgi:hypothetical protein